MTNELDDAISRILKRMWNCRGKHTISIDKVAMEQIIRDELSVTQKSGKWIMSRDCYGNHHFTCSECGNDIATQYADNWNDKYCSECGAKMEREG